MRPQLDASVYGNGPDLVLLHGLFGSRDNLRSLGKMLSEHYRIHALDLRNHGKSFHADTMSYPEMANDVLDYLTHNGLDHTFMVGHSMGGKVAMQAGIMCPEKVKALVILDIAPVNYALHTLSDRHDSILAGLQHLSRLCIKTRGEADRIMQTYINDSTTRAFILKNLKKNDSGYLELQLNTEAIIHNYDNILDTPAGPPFPNPTLFIKGQMSDYMQEKYRNDTLRLFPEAKLEVIKGVGHWLHAENPQGVFAGIANFLKSVPG